jgi:hypothetical protein
MVRLAIRCPQLELQGGPSDRSAHGSFPETGRAALDRVLELLERTQRSPTELRVLLGLLDREASLPELADALGQGPTEIRRAGQSLAMRGLVRWQHVGRNKQTRLGITATGSAAMRVWLTAGGEKAALERTGSC